MSNIENTEKDNTENVENVENTENVENAENTENAENVENTENVENVDRQMGAFEALYKQPLEMIAAKTEFMIDKMTKTLIHHKKDFSDTDMYVGEMVLRNTIRSMVNEVKAMSCGQNTKKLFTDILLEVGGEKLDKRLKKTINLKYKSDKYSDSNSPYYMQDGDLWMVNDHGNSILLSNGIFCVDTIIKSDGHYYFGGSISSKDGKFVARFELPSSYWGDVSHKLTKEIKSIAGHHMQFSKTDAAKIIEASEILITDKAQKEYRPFGFTDNLDEYFGGKILITANDYIDCSDAKSKYILRKSGGSATKYLGLDAPLEDMKPLLQHLHKELRGFNNTNVMSFLLGTVFISPLTSWMAKNCGKTSALPSMVLHGPSGKGKTGMLILAQNFFGFTHGHLNSFYSTAKALLDNGSKYRDAIFVLDDLKYSSKSETEQRNIKELLQGYADGSSKDRMVQEDGLWVADSGKSISGTLCISSEDLPTNETSISSRIMIIDLDSQIKDDTLYTTCLEQSKNYSRIMSHFIRWIITNCSKVDFKKVMTKKLTDIVNKFNADYPADVINSTRITVQVALNCIGYELLHSYLLANDIIGKEEKDALVEQHRELCKQLIAKRIGTVKEYSQPEIIINTFKQLLSVGKIRVSGYGATVEDTPATRCIPVVGFYKDKLFYFYPDILIAEIQDLLRKSDEKIPANKNSIAKILGATGYIALKDKDRYFYSKRHNGAISKFIVISAEKMGIDVEEEI